MRPTAIILSIVCLVTSAVAAGPKTTGHPPRGEIDALFAALSKAGSEEEAKPIEEKILTAFLRSGSPTVDLLMTRAAASLQRGDAPTAKQLVVSVTSIKPDYAEGWHQRAQMQDASGDDQGAMFCLEKTVTLNPRHFEALVELGSKIEEYGDKTGALKLYRRAMALDPYYEGITRRVRALSHDVEGESL